MLINSLNFPPVKQYGFYSEGFVYFVCILPEASLGFYCQDYKYFRNLDSLTAFYSYKTIASANYAANCPPFLPENEKPEEPALSEEELMEKIVREAKISWEKRKEREELMEIRRKEQIEARRKAREAEEEQESKDEI